MLEEISMQNSDLGCTDREAVVNTEPVSHLVHSLDSGSYRRIEPLLGGEIQESVYYSKHNSCFDRVSKVVTQTLELITSYNLNEVFFVTIRPSPEYVYMLNNGLPSYENQIHYIMNLINHPLVSIISGSIEKGGSKKSKKPRKTLGMKNTQILHYHLVVKSTKKKFKKWLKHVTDHVTCLHKVYGYQKAVVVSETQAGNISEGVKYFNGISKNVTDKLKPDVYKHIIGGFLIKTFKNLFSKL